MLESVTRTYRDQGGDVFLVHVRPHVLEFMKSTRFFEFLGDDHFLDGDTIAIEHLFYRVIDPAVCIYECDVRIWRECLNLPRPAFNAVLDKQKEVDLPEFPELEAIDLWRRIHEGPLAPLVIDVREPREHNQERIIGSELKSLPTLPQSMTGILRHRPLVLVCRSGRRSVRAAAVLHDSGFKEISILKGGLIAWKAAGLLTAVEVSDNH
jgi:SulP family sulfate permease